MGMAHRIVCEFMMRIHMKRGQAMRQKKGAVVDVLQKVSMGSLLSMVVMLALLVCHRDVLPGELFMYDVLPLYGYSGENAVAKLFQIPLPGEVQGGEAVDGVPVFYMDGTGSTATQAQADYDDGVTRMESTWGMDVAVGDVVGKTTVIYQPESEYRDVEQVLRTDSSVAYSVEELRDPDVLRSRFYSVESTTQFTAQDFNIDAFLAADLRIQPSGGEPKILIFHTHSTEFFADSDRADVYSGIVGVGKRLADILTNEYGIPTMHCAERFDYSDGKSQITGAYERMEPTIQRILAENPSIEIVIDMHRDGVPSDSIKFVTNVNGKDTAKIMFVNGLTKLLENGKLSEIANLPNPYLADNLAFSFRMQMAAGEMFPELARKVYLKAYRYSLHMRPKSLLVEVGAQTNTVEEAMNAMEPLAAVLAEVVQP